MTADELVPEAHSLGLTQNFHIAGSGLDHAFHADDVVNLLQEEHVYLGAVVDAGKVYSQPKQLGDCMQAVVRRRADVVQQLLFCPVVELLFMHVAASALQGAHGLENSFFKGAAYAHHLSGGLHLGAQFIGSLAELVKGEAGYLGYNVVDCGLCAGRLSGNGNLVQSKAYGYFCSHAGNREAAGLGCQGG